MKRTTKTFIGGLVGGFIIGATVAVALYGTWVLSLLDK